MGRGFEPHGAHRFVASNFREGRVGPLPGHYGGDLGAPRGPVRDEVVDVRRAAHANRRGDTIASDRERSLTANIEINVLDEKIEPDAGALHCGHASAADSPPALERALVVGEVRRESEIGCSISVVPTAAVVAHPLRVEVTLRGLPGVIGRAVRHLGRRRQDTVGSASVNSSRMSDSVSW